MSTNIVIEMPEDAALRILTDKEKFIRHLRETTGLDILDVTVESIPVVKDASKKIDI